MNTRRVLSVVASVAAGAVAGAAIGMLYAPDKGSSTRKKIVEKGAEVADNIRNRVENAKMGMHKNFAGTPQQEVHEVNTML